MIKIPTKFDEWTRYNITEFNSIYKTFSGYVEVNETLRLMRFYCFTGASSNNIDYAYLCTLPKKVVELLDGKSIGLYSVNADSSGQIARSIYIEILNDGTARTTTYDGDYAVYHIGCSEMFYY